MSNDCCNKGSIVDVDCVYEDGKFIIGGTDACRPEIFTVRFRAPADYKAGDLIVLREKELPVRTPGMVSAATDIFKAGAIVHADIDLVSRRAFVWMGGAGGALPNLSYEEQFAGYYDWDGDKVYVRSVDMGAINTTTIMLNHNISNVKIIDYRFRHETGEIMTNSNSHPTYWHYTSVSSAQCRYYTSQKYGGGTKGMFTIYYTCTDR